MISDTQSMDKSTPALNCKQLQHLRTQVDFRSEIRHGKVDLAHVDSGIQIDVRLGNGGRYIGRCGGGGVNDRVRVAREREGVAGVAGAGGRLRTDEPGDQENGKDEA